MPDKDVEILKKLAEAINNLNDFDKGYVLGKGEKKAELHQIEKQEADDNKTA